MLGVDAGDAVKVRGDTLGSFWTLSEAALDHARDVPASHHDHVPPDVRREAYWWGPQARNTSTLPVLGAVSGYLSQAGWLLLLPLGLANVAYWSRRLGAPGTYGRGAKSIRVFGLVLSLLLTASVAVVALDVVGTQCIVDRGTDGTEKAEVVCSGMPTWLGWLTGYSWSERLVILSLVPVAVLLFLRWLSGATSVRYERPSSAAIRSGRDRDQDDARVPVLARKGLWSRWELTRSMSFLHLAGGLALVTAVLAWSRVYLADPVTGRQCLDAGTFLHNPFCYSTALVSKPWSVVALVAAFLVLAWAVIESARSRADTVPEGRSSATAIVVLVVAVVVFVGHSAVMLALDVPQPAGVTLAGLNTTPGILLAFLLGFGLAGLGWRRRAVSWLWYVLAGGVVAALAVNAFGLDWAWGSFGEPWVVLASLGLVLLLVLSVRPANSDEATRRWREQAWSGTGPGVFLLLAAGTQMLLCALLVVAAGDWLNGAPDAADLAGGGVVTIPATYSAFAVAMLLGGTLLVVYVVGAASLMWWLGRTPLDGAPVGVPEEPLAKEAAEDAQFYEPAGRLADLESRADLQEAIASGRRLAAITHRAEVVTGMVAAGFAVAVAGTILLASDGIAGPSESNPASGDLVLTWGVNIGLLAMAVLWTSAVLRVVTAGGDRGRPIALIWDLMCFLPRSAHPFGPPCYAERAVPEIAARADAWLRGDDVPTPPAHRSPEVHAAIARRRVVLSAHSLGAVLAVASLFTDEPASAAQTEERSGGTLPVGSAPAGRGGRVALLTYGTQLRAYFGRMFPEFIGPEVLGTSGLERAQVGAADPWRRDVHADVATAGPPVPDSPAGRMTVVGRLGGSARPRGGAPGLFGDTPERRPAWVSLWRRTDFLGFPVASYRPNVVDRGAEELDATSYVATVATHGGYPLSSAYRRAFREVLERLPEPPAPPG